ncbi:SHOCT domain-containing protein [Gemmata sp.]|uniref:SHOCT domain-containing protein n=1 Tax=Gemmata sp. TaxID=1914242 RepID=UPI003F703830
MVWSPVAARGDVRKWRLHACGCARTHFPPRAAKKWLAFLDLAERYADGEITAEEFTQAQAPFHRGRRPRLTGVSGDFDLALRDSENLATTWRDLVIAANRSYEPGDHQYDLVLPRFRVLTDLIGPGPLPEFDPSWRTSTAVALAQGMYDSRDFGAMPILADALQDAGCGDAVIVRHCQDTGQLHVRGCWVVDLVLGRPQGPPVKKKRSRRRRTT